MKSLKEKYGKKAREKYVTPDRPVKFMDAVLTILKGSVING